MLKRKKDRRTVPCAYCGAQIRADARACPHCGSDESTGWSEERYLDGIDLPGEADYDELLDKEFPERGRTASVHWTAVVGAAVLVLVLLGIIRIVL